MNDNISLYFSECLHLLLAHNALVKIKNNLGWNPLAEAISYGDRQTSGFSSINILKVKSLLNIMFVSSYFVVEETETTRERVPRRKKTKTYTGTQANG